ncbi:MAG: winged helix-turn-helix domain-containing protein [Nitrososphaerales archaeon]
MALLVKNRSSTEIIDAMLRSIKSGVPKTHIMYSAFISYKQLEDYLRILEEKAWSFMKNTRACFRLRKRVFTT